MTKGNALSATSALLDGFLFTADLNRCLQNYRLAVNFMIITTIYKF